MRDTSLTDDDLAMMAAKENLASLSGRAGYHEAMGAPRRSKSRIGQLVCIALALLFGALAIASWKQIDPLWLRIAVGVVVGALALFTGLLALGMSPDQPPQRWGVAVAAKHLAPDGSELVTVLREDGSSHDLPAAATIYAMLRIGDCGVAEVTTLPTGTPVMIVSFYRL